MYPRLQILSACLIYVFSYPFLPILPLNPFPSFPPFLPFHFTLPFLPHSSHFPLTSFSFLPFLLFNISFLRPFLHHASERENAADEICDSISKYLELNADDKDKEKEKEKDKERDSNSASPMPGDSSMRNGNGSHSHLNSNSNSNNNGNGSNSNGGNGGKQEHSQEIKNIDKERDKDKDKDKGKDEKKGGIKAVNGMESGRLIKLLQQAFAYQITQSMTSSLCTFEKQEVSLLVPVRTTASGTAATVIGGGGGGVGAGGGVGVVGGVMVRSIEDSVGEERGGDGKERAIIGGDKMEGGETVTVTAGAAIKSPSSETSLTTLTTMTTTAAAVVQGVDDVITGASGGLEKEERKKGMVGTAHAAITSSFTSTLALSSSSSSFSSSAVPVTDSSRLPLPATEHSSLPPSTLPLSLPPPLPPPLPLPLSEILPPHIPHTVNNNVNTQGMSEGRGGWIDPVPRVHRLIEDFKPTVLPGTLTAILTVNPLSSIPYNYTQPSINTHPEAQNTQYRDNYTVPQRNLGDIRCFSMLPASSTGTGSGLFPSYLAGNRDSAGEFQSQLNRKGRNRITVVAGTDRGSLILWQVPSSLPPLHSEYETSSGVFDIAHPSFSQRLLPPSAILHLRKGDNVRVRRTYRSDDDDSTDLFPPKIRDVAVSSSTGSLGWFHSDSPSDSFLLVAAALSDGTIALVCAGDAVNDSDEGGLRNGRRGRERGRDRGREGDRDRDDSVNRRGISSNRARSQSRLNCFESDRRDDRERENNDHSKPLYSFSQKRCYLETHEVSYTMLLY